MAYTDQATLADDATFRSRVRVALATAAVQVAGEAKSGYSDVQYGKRQALAYDVLKAAANGLLLEAFIWTTVANPAITGASSDSDIQFTVNSSWGDIAGVRIDD
jgi:hypothetical protein